MNNFLAIGIILLVGVVGAKLLNRLKLPSVVAWLIVGAILGQSGFNLISPEILERFGFISDTTLGLIGFVIGAQITFGALKKLGRSIIVILVAQFLGAYLLVFLGVFLYTGNLILALLLGTIATATAPATTIAVLHEQRARGPLTKALLIIVGLGDALAIIVYTFTVSYSKVILGGADPSVAFMMGKPLLELLLAISIGGGLGLLYGLWTDKIRSPEFFLVTGLGTILICVGLSKLLDFSLILSTLIFGLTLVNLFPRVSARVSDSISQFLPPFYVCFFALAGAHLNLPSLLGLGTLGVIYIITRSCGKIGGAWLGTYAGRQIPKYIGLGLLSQAGVAIGLAYLIQREFAFLGPEGQAIGAVVLSIIAATTVILEIIGPLFTKAVIIKAKEKR